MEVSMFAFLAFGFLALVVGSIIFFIVSLVLYRAAKREMCELPRPEYQKNLSSRKVLLIVSSLIMGVLLAVVLGIVIMFYFAIAYM